MPLPRTILSLTAMFVLLALATWGCSSSDDETATDAQPAAAVVPADVASIEVSSPVFSEIRPRKRIPKQNTCFAENMSPPLSWSGIPAGATSLALIVEEPEERISALGSYTAVASGSAVHWVLYNMPVDLTGLPEAVPTSTSVLPDGTVQGMNDFDGTGYSGPCPPTSVVRYRDVTGREGRFSSDPPHDYYFKLYALDTQVDLAPGATRDELLSAMEGHVLAFGETMGKYQSPRQQRWFTDSGGTPIPNTPTPVP